MSGEMMMKIVILFLFFVIVVCSSNGRVATASPVNAYTATYDSNPTLPSVDTSCPSVVLHNSFMDGILGMSRLAKDLALLEAENRIAGGENSVDDKKIKKILWDFSKNFVWLPMSLEEEYGRLEHTSWEKSGYLLPRSDRNAKYYNNADELLTSILKAIGEDTEYHFQVYVHKRADTRALAMPGGRVYLYKGILDYNLQDKKGQATAAKQRDKALFILAHEMAHVLQRHQTKHLQNRIIYFIDLKDALNQVKTLRSGKDPSNVIGLVLLGKKQFIRNYIEQELQADSCGVRLANQALKGDRQRLQTALIAFLNELTARGVSNNDKLSKLSDKNKTNYSMDEVVHLVGAPVDQHPTTAERASRLAETYKSLK